VRTLTKRTSSPAVLPIHTRSQYAAYSVSLDYREFQQNRYFRGRHSGRRNARPYIRPTDSDPISAASRRAVADSASLVSPGHSAAMEAARSACAGDVALGPRDRLQQRPLPLELPAVAREEPPQERRRVEGRGAAAGQFRRGVFDGEQLSDRGTVGQRVVVVDDELRAPGAATRENSSAIAASAAGSRTLQSPCAVITSTESAGREGSRSRSASSTAKRSPSPSSPSSSPSSPSSSTRRRVVRRRVILVVRHGVHPIGAVRSRAVRRSRSRHPHRLPDTASRPPTDRRARP